jgi:hypothetical protein
LDLSTFTITPFSTPIPQTYRTLLYSCPFLFLVTDLMLVLDQDTGGLLQQLPIPAGSVLCDGMQNQEELKDEEYSVLVLCDSDGAVYVADYQDADRTVGQLMEGNQVQTAFAVLHRNQAVHNSVFPWTFPDL